MPNDPSGYLEAIAEIPKGQLSERQQRIATGLAMINEGSSCNAAAIAVNIPAKTMWRHNQGYVALTDEKGVQINERALVAASFDMAQIAAQKITDRLLDETREIKDADLVKIYGVATDKIAMKRGWTRGLSAADEKTQDALAGALQHLRDGKQIQIIEPDPVSEAIDVESIPTDSK